jgi:hypothetical protein
MKTCSRCKENKDVSLFGKKSSWCKSCKCEYAKEYRLNNQELVRERNREWYEVKGRQHRKEYRQKRLEEERRYENERYHNDPNFRMRKILRTRLIKTIKGIKTSKSLMSYVDVDILTFVKWIEYQWHDNMSWDNYGSLWEVDHVIPCSSYDLTIEDNKKECFHWSNMRPLLKTQNMSKSNKIIEDVIKEHQKVVASFKSINDGTKV